jgi:hypothetical protein
LNALRGANGTCPMVKIVALLKRRADLSVEDFVHHYETRHAPLALSHMSGAARYVRRYLRPVPRTLAASTEMDEAGSCVDAIAELWVEDSATADLVLAELARPAVAAAISADEERFLDRAQTRLFIVDERESTCPPRPARGVDGASPDDITDAIA